MWGLLHSPRQRCVVRCGVVLAFRFSRPQDLRDTLTLQAGRHPGSHLAAQVRAFLRPKCLAVLLDSSMHGLDVVAFNLHQLSLLGAAKFHATAKALPLGVAHNPAVLVEAVVGAVEYLAVLVRQRTGGSLSPPVGSGGAGSGAAATRNHLVRMGTYCALSRRQVSGCHLLFSPLLSLSLTHSCEGGGRMCLDVGWLFRSCGWDCMPLLPCLLATLTCNKQPTHRLSPVTC